MDKEIIGAISGAVVFFSAIPYAWRTYQKKIQPQITTWFLWTLVGLAIFLTCKDSGIKENIWPTLFGFTNPFVITVLAYLKKDKVENPQSTRLHWLDKLCVSIVTTVLISWFLLRDNSELMQFTLYGAIIASAISAIPTIMSIRKDPNSDRPFAWALLGLGYLLAIFAVKEPLLKNFAVPIYMVTVATWFVLTLTLYRVKNRIRIKEWI